MTEPGSGSPQCLSRRTWLLAARALGVERLLIPAQVDVRHSRDDRVNGFAVRLASFLAANSSPETGRPASVSPDTSRAKYWTAPCTSVLGRTFVPMTLKSLVQIPTLRHCSWVACAAQFRQSFPSGPFLD
jgi:hypothetical protein